MADMKHYESQIEDVKGGMDTNSSLEHGVATEDPAQIKRILRKCDLRILPVMSILYLLSFLDRTAIGNARIAGLAKDLKLTPIQYATSVTVFFVFYGLLEVPSNLMLKQYGARKWIPFIMFFWGVVMMCTAFVTNYSGLLACRFMLGATEAGLFPGVTYYLTTWYRRSESQFRIGFFFSAATIAGAFGGLLAFGLTKIPSGSLVKEWGYIFLIEGILTIIAAVWAYWAIVDSPATAKFLTPEEKEILQSRLKYDGVAVPMNDEFKWKFVWQGIFDYKVWMCFAIYICSLTPIYSVALNLPVITVGLGYTGPEAQLITVPVYVCASIFVIVLALIADKYQTRAPILIFGMALSMIGYIIMYVTNPPGVRYFGAFLAAAGAYGGFPAVVCLLTNNSGGKTKRSTQIGILIGIGGFAGMISSNIFPASQGPRYRQGIMINIGLNALGIALTAIYSGLLMMANKRKERMIASGEAAKYSDAELADMGDSSPFFKFTI